MREGCEKGWIKFYSFCIIFITTFNHKTIFCSFDAQRQIHTGFMLMLKSFFQTSCVQCIFLLLYEIKSSVYINLLANFTTKILTTNRTLAIQKVIYLCVCRVFSSYLTPYNPVSYLISLLCICRNSFHFQSKYPIKFATSLLYKVL